MIATSPNQYLIAHGQDPELAGGLESQLQKYVDEVARLQKSQPSMSFEEFMAQEMNHVEQLGECQNICEVSKYKKAHPVNLIVTKLLFGPNRYASIPSFQDLSKEDYRFVKQEDAMKHWKNEEGSDPLYLPELIKRHRETWCGKRVKYCDVPVGKFSWIYFKSRKYPIVRTKDSILVQYTVYQKDSRSDDLIYLFCETFVMDDHLYDGLRGRLRLCENDFHHYGGFTEFVPEMLLKENEDVKNFRKLIFEGEVRGDTTHRIPDEIVLKLGFHGPD